jgi:hypothetical protein
VTDRSACVERGHGAAFTTEYRFNLMDRGAVIGCPGRATLAETVRRFAENTSRIARLTEIVAEGLLVSGRAFEPQMKAKSAPGPMRHFDLCKIDAGKGLAECAKWNFTVSCSLLLSWPFWRFARLNRPNAIVPQ